MLLSSSKKVMCACHIENSKAIVFFPQFKTSSDAGMRSQHTQAATMPTNWSSGNLPLPPIQRFYHYMGTPLERLANIAITLPYPLRSTNGTLHVFTVEPAAVFFFHCPGGCSAGGGMSFGEAASESWRHTVDEFHMESVRLSSSQIRWSEIDLGSETCPKKPAHLRNTTLTLLIVEKAFKNQKQSAASKGLWPRSPFQSCTFVDDHNLFVNQT